MKGIEICGLLIHNGSHIEIHETKNISNRLGSWRFEAKQIRSIVKAVGILNHEVVGTFHSHPVGLARPGDNDIENAIDDSLILIVDCEGKEALLYRIKNGKARKLNFYTMDV